MFIKRILKKCLIRFSGSFCLMFHHIDNGEILQKSGCVLSYEKFVNILDSGLEFISVDEYIAFSKKSRNKCAITFDDGLSDVYSVAYPELKKRQIPFTVFVITDFLDQEGYLTTQELEILAADPLVTVGAHGVTHNVLKGMDGAQQEIELQQSKRLAEQLIGREVKYFAFSHGLYDETTLNLLKESKAYSNAFGVVGVPLNFVTKQWKYHLPRINCENNKMNFEIVAKKNKTIVSIKL